MSNFDIYLINFYANPPTNKLKNHFFILKEINMISAKRHAHETDNGISLFISVNKKILKKMN